MKRKIISFIIGAVLSIPMTVYAAGHQSKGTVEQNMKVIVVHAPEETEAPEEEPQIEMKKQIKGMVPVYSRKTIDYISMDDFILLGKCVWAEARGESFEGQVAVAEVILNRVESDDFPDSIPEVIKQKNQFESWSNGSISKAPLDDSCLEAVETAIEERTFPENVVYFREGHYHTYGNEYCSIEHHYFSTGGE